ncbi:Cyclic nucleotide-gated ion channel, putative [Ricinus communis]|uniref:Cyclic nucleotide-gated ion channel, putative n=1 Tax=Ricinus communis TaxID=3988 RepID=B9RUB3_RICCO|nr:Cyclic nucleotide-gated ion channel, putative [Ricinus communis]
MNRFIPNPNSKLRHFRRLHHHLTSPSLASSATSLSDANPLHILWHYQILDPDSDIVTYWNYVFLITSIVALFVDPLFFFLPYADADGVCLTNDASLAVLITYFRSFADLFFLLHIIMKFRTAFVAPNSRVFGRGELVMDAKEIARRYLRSDFVIDLAAALPLPQVVIWVVIPAARNGRADHANNTLSLIVLIQYIPRLFVIFPLHQRIVKSTGFIAKTAWAGAAYNLLLYMLASHVRIRFINNSSNKTCTFYYMQLRHMCQCCLDTYSLCGVRNLYEIDFPCNSYAQTLETSTFLGENIFCIVTCIIGLVLSAQLIGNMQTNLQSMTVRVEEWRIKRRDTEEWMRHRQLPPDLQERVRRFVQYKWLATRGVHEESILRSLPLDLRREIQRHLCLALVRRVPFFSQMDDQLLDAICERLVSSLSTEGTYIFSEGDPVNEMLFIIRGTLESSTTNGGRSGFFNSITLRPGDFCGEELLTWALMPNSSAHLPASTRTVKALSEVEAFALQAEDLIFVAQQFKRLQSKKLQHAFRYYSHQWRTWGAILIQSVWRRYQKRKMARELASRESLSYIQIPEDGYYSSNELAEGDYEDEHGESLSMENANNAQHLGATILASKFAANTRRGINQRLVDSASSSVKVPKLFKPVEPDFFADHV